MSKLPPPSRLELSMPLRANTKTKPFQIHKLHRNMYTCTLNASKNRLQRNWLRSDQTMRPRAFGTSGCQRARIACAPMEWSTDSRGVYHVVQSGRRDAPLPEIAQLAAIILDERLPRDGANGCHKKCTRLRLKLNTDSKKQQVLKMQHCS